MRIIIRSKLVLILGAMVVMLVLAGPAMAEFGLQKFAISARNQDGTPDVQAGSHPFALTNTFVLHLNPANLGSNTKTLQEGTLKDVRLELPPGFVGDPNATPHCPYQVFIKEHCPDETAVGVATTYLAVKGRSIAGKTSDPVYNLVPPTGVAAEFAFIVADTAPVFLQTSVRTGTDYGLTTTVPNINQSIIVAANKVTIWGVPADPAHNDLRGSCVGEILNGVEGGFYGGPNEQPPFNQPDPTPEGLAEGEDEVEGPLGVGESPLLSNGECATQTPLVPLLTNPTSCGAPRMATLGVDDWEQPGVYHSLTTSLPELSGCEKLDFSPTIGVVPDGARGSTPTGLTVGLHVPQETTENPVGLAEADVKDTTVTLPAGVTLSASASDGLQACSIAQIGYTGMKELDPIAEPGVQTPQFKERVLNPANGREEATACPDASKIANVHIKTPLLEHEIEGQVYLAAPQNFALAGAPQENPFSSLVSMYLVAEEPVAGVLVKLAGKVTPNPVTGQIVTTFENTPALPFSDLKFEFFGTDRAPLVTPALCGTYTTNASLTPWSGTPATDATSSFPITSGPQVQTASGPQTTGCPNPPGDQSLSTLPFAPSLQSGTTNINTGSYSDLTTTFSREDGQQNLSSIQLHYPAGLSGLLSGVTLCPEAQANAGTCGAASQIGETIVGVGLGNDPFNVTGGGVYITGPYEGAPFGLSIVNPAKAGPFDLQEGRPVVVRAKIEVNPITAALTVTTNAPGTPYSIPTIIDGIPLQIKHVYVNINRPDFVFNPTNCTPTAVTGTIDSAEGASVPVSDPFQVTNCGSLKFTPKFAVSTSGKTSKASGASLTATVTEPVDPQSQANIARVKVELPNQLPSRLTTLQKACLAKIFEENPAACPGPSFIGHAVVHTKLLPVPLEGPAIFVSHGGEAFPSLEVVLQGDNVTIDLVGATYISKSGITSTTFKTVPDEPFETFEITLPEGPDSALAAIGNLCTSELTMPTEFVAQNGAAIYQNTPISVTGCAKVKALTRSQKLQKSLKACRSKNHKKARRERCEKAARKTYGPVKKAKKGKR